MEDIVSQHQADAVRANKLFADDKRLRQSVRRRLLRVLKMYAIILPIPKQPPKSRQVLWRRYNENVPYPCQHQHADGIIDHRLVINGK